MAFDLESDEGLVARAGRGDRAAAGELIVRHSSRVLAVCWRLLGDRAAAEDASQETFLRLWRSAASWKPGAAKFSTWLYRVATNVCLDRLRTRGRETSAEEAPEIVDGDPRADEMLEAADRAAAVRAALAALPERQRIAIVLRHYEGLSNIEASEAMGVTVEAVEALTGRAKRALKAALLPMRDELLSGGGRELTT